jgi:glycosyltransferase involved in cell wall biosynthesis
LPERPIFIGIPAFNKADTVEACIRSVIREVLSLRVSSNIVICDDCSTDGTAEILRQVWPEYPELKHCRSMRRSGKAAAINLLLSLARQAMAEVVCFFDADITCEFGSLRQMLSCLDTAPGKLVTGSVLPDTWELRFPLQQIFAFKRDTEILRATHRPYVNGRSFAVRLSDFPELPSDLWQCEDRYLTVVLGVSRLVSCSSAVFKYMPPSRLRALFADRFRSQERLIKLATKHPGIYASLRCKRFSFFHTYLRTYPKKAQWDLLTNAQPLSCLALTIERAILICAKIAAEVAQLLGASPSEETKIPSPFGPVYSIDTPKGQGGTRLQNRGQGQLGQRRQHKV